MLVTYTLLLSHIGYEDMSAKPCGLQHRHLFSVMRGETFPVEYRHLVLVMLCTQIFPQGHVGYADTSPESCRVSPESCGVHIYLPGSCSVVDMSFRMRLCVRLKCSDLAMFTSVSLYIASCIV